jgi:5-methylcytosine-specific restriction enzyme subunit McrC
MPIPIQNIYYLLCYAWNRLDEGEVVRVADMESPEVADLFAHVLVNGFDYLRRRGLHRGYVPHVEETRTLRGRVCFGHTLKRNLLERRATAICAFDELSYDVPHNRILKSTALLLRRVPRLDDGLRERLDELCAILDEVQTIQLSRTAFRQVQLSRNNAFYQFLLSICELVAENLFISTDTGEASFRDFLRDEKKMSGLFEEFVRNFYKREQTAYSVSSMSLHWVGSWDARSGEVLPGMQTDITLQGANRHLIIDTKYYARPIVEYHGRQRLGSANLYQIFAYLSCARAAHPDAPPWEGMLLYAMADEEFDYSYELLGFPVRVCAVNLNQPWRDIHARLLGLAGCSRPATSGLR